MGDRRMAEVKLAKGSIYIYSHWGGYEMATDAVEAIKSAQPRWADESYAARIIVDQLTKGSRDSETGHGLMLGPDAEDSYNNDQPSILIDLANQTFKVTGEGGLPATPFDEL